jgi:hypothetical protein
MKMIRHHHEGQRHGAAGGVFHLQRTNDATR